MKIIHPYVDLIQQEPGFNGIMKHIERCGRTCYKSEDKITDDSADTFVANLIKNKHYAMLEHGTVYLKIPGESEPDEWGRTYPIIHKGDYSQNPYSIVNWYDYDQPAVGTQKDFFDYIPRSIEYVTTNYRVLEENSWLDDLQYICEPTEFHTPRITLKFTTNIGVTREANRMRANSIAEESTRYCNYTRNKFGGQLNIVPPVWMSDEDSEYAIKHWDQDQWLTYLCDTLDTRNPDFFNADAIDWYGMAIAFAEIAYMQLIRLGWTPQQAREVLPLATKSEVVYTAFPHQWKHFFDLRLFGTTGKPHPNMQEIAELAQGVLEENGLWELIYPNNDKIQ